MRSSHSYVYIAAAVLHFDNIATRASHLFALSKYSIIQGLRRITSRTNKATLVTLVFPKRRTVLAAAPIY